MPTNLLCIDTETKVVIKGNKQFHRLKLGWTVKAAYKKNYGVTNESWHFWDSAYKLCKYIDATVQRDSILYMFGVNIYFDLQASDFFYFMTRWGWICDFSFDKGSTYILIIRKGRKTIKIMSTTNFWTNSARQLGSMLGYHKADPDFHNVSPSDLMCYCFRDTEIVLESMVKYIRFLEINDLGMFRVSRASQSYAAFRHRFMEHKIMAHEDPIVRELETNAYMGGRVECFHVGEVQDGPFVCYDVNSMYPHVMRDCKMPIKPVDYYANPPRADICDVINEYALVAFCRVSTDVPAYAIKYGGKTIYPIGTFNAYLTTPSIKYAIEHDHLRRVYRAVVYEQENIFKEYIDFFYTIREKAKQGGDPVWNKASKIFMNSLYGKFGQRRPIIESDEEIESEDYKREEIWDHETKRYLITTSMMNRRITQYGSEPCRGTVIAIPAHITDYARMLLWNIIEGAGKNAVVYCDTDSIFIRERDTNLIKHPIHPTALGSLSRKWVSKSLVLNGCKDYTTDRETVLKGIPAKSPEIAPGIYRVLQWPKQRTHLHDRQNRYYVCRQIDKRARSEYTKGIVDTSGSVRPFTFPLSRE